MTEDRDDNPQRSLDASLEEFFVEQQARILHTLAKSDARREDRRWDRPWVGREALTEFEHRK